MSKAPEVQIALFGFLAAFVWEMWQMPFYDQSGLTFMNMVKGCSLGSLGDAGIMVFAYKVAARVVGSPGWIAGPPRKAVLAYLATGLLITVVIEHIAINVGFGWRYSALMPREPVFGTGLVPIVMWIVVPLATLWLVRRPPLLADR
ncbi:MAG: hypothetical protein HKN78_08115 [Sphingomonadaceae bacterium]|nr:hypothetical protein [Sphingomonadaceae bacterium]